MPDSGMNAPETSLDRLDWTDIGSQLDAEGYAAVVVNGQVLLEHGRHTGALPGHVLR